MSANGKTWVRPRRFTPTLSFNPFGVAPQAAPQPSAFKGPLMAFSDPLDDIQVEVRHATLLPAPRTPGFASPGTFPSRCFSHPQGFAPPSPFTALFHAVAAHRISSTTPERSRTSPAITTTEPPLQIRGSFEGKPLARGFGVCLPCLSTPGKPGTHPHDRSMGQNPPTE